MLCMQARCRHDASVAAGYSPAGDNKPNSLLCIADSDQASFAKDQGSCDLSNRQCMVYDLTGQSYEWLEETEMKRMTGTVMIAGVYLPCSHVA